MTGSGTHYVYLYRDERGRARYVGYGEQASRATDHLIDSHNPRLAQFVMSNKFTIEVTGPFPTEEMGRVVETVLISALEPDLNEIRGSSSARLRPLGVPVEFAHRLSLASMRREEFISVQGNSPMPVMFVSIGQQDFDGGRVGYNSANPPSDEQILRRVEKWWQVQRFLKEWSTNPQQSPGILVGVHGKPGAQMVIAAVVIDRSGWNSVESFERGEGKIRIPTLPTRNLDAFELRGRRIDRNLELRSKASPLDSSFSYILMGLQRGVESHVGLYTRDEGEDSL